MQTPTNMPYTRGVMQTFSVLVNLLVKADSHEQAEAFAYARLAAWFNEETDPAGQSRVTAFPAGTLLLYGPAIGPDRVQFPPPSPTSREAIDHGAKDSARGMAAELGAPSQGRCSGCGDPSECDPRLASAP